MSSFVWLDGAIIDADRARISPFDRGLTVGDGVFETVKVTRGLPFAMRRHLERLDRSASVLGLPLIDHDLLRAAVGETITANAMSEGRLRITLTGGTERIGPDRQVGEPTLLIAVSDVLSGDHGIDVITVEWPRNERGALAGVKSISYAENLVAMAQATNQGAGEAIFANTLGNLCEGSRSNVFVGMDGRLITPPLSAGPLPGVTRELLLEVVEVVEVDLPLAALAEADEAFITGSIRGVQGIRRVDGVALRLCPGPLTLAAEAALARLEGENLDP